MKQTLFAELKAALSGTDYLDGGNLLRPRIAVAARSHDPKLIENLLGHEATRQAFFIEAGGAYVFKADDFARLVQGHEFLPSSHTAYASKIGLTMGGKYLKTIDDVVLDFPYKDCVLAGGQSREEEARQELFYHEVLARDEISCLLEPKAFANPRRVTADGESPCDSFSGTDNLLIKGNNLFALHALKRRFAGKVKLIYIDPPYNTGSDAFKYNDRFNHSAWLVFMKNRLEVAKDLLSETGTIHIQIGDKNEARIRLILDEIFGQDNFINKVTIRTRSPSGFKTVNLGVFETAEYIYIYGRNKAKWKYKTQYIPSAWDDNYSNVIINKELEPDQWIFADIKDIVSKKLGYESKANAQSSLGEHGFVAACSDFALKNAQDVFRYTQINDDAGRETLRAREESLANPNTILCVSREGMSDRLVVNGQEITFYSKKVRNIDGELCATMLLTNIWTDISWEGIAGEGKVKLKKGKKPERLVRRVIAMSTDEGDLVLDFFAGSGTTLAVAHKMGRRWIGVEQMDYIDTITQARLKKVLEGEQGGISKAVDWQGGGEFVTVELAKWNASLLDEIQSASGPSEIAALLEKIQRLPFSAFINYTASPEFLFDANKTDDQGRRFIDLPLPEQKQLLTALLDKNYLYVNLPDLDAPEMGFDETTRRFNRSFYGDG